MAELIGDSGYDDVQATAPTSPSIGDTWLDTSTDPPTGKIYADLGSGGQWTTDLIDAQISTRATQSDILSDGTAFDGANIDAKISKAGLETLSNFTTTQNIPTFSKSVNVNTGETLSGTFTYIDVSGTGAFFLPDTLFDYQLEVGNSTTNDGSMTMNIVVDGNAIHSDTINAPQDDEKHRGLTFNGVIPFESSIVIDFDYSFDMGDSYDGSAEVKVSSYNTENNGNYTVVALQ